MAVLQKVRQCDKCKNFQGVPQEIVRQLASGDGDGGQGVLSKVEVDLCAKCQGLVDNAIKRAVKAK